MAEVSHAVLLPECYRNSSPRSASTPGPSAPDSPATSASGRVSASPAVSSGGAGSALLSPPIPPPVNCFNTGYHYSQYANHLGPHHPALGLMGTFLSVGSYSPYAALAATLAAGMSAPMASQLVAPVSLHHHHHPLTRLRQSASSASSASLPGPRTLPFSVENILKPDFGRALAAAAAAASASSADSDHEAPEVSAKSSRDESIKQESSSSNDSTTPSKRFKADYGSGSGSGSKNQPSTSSLSAADTDAESSDHERRDRHQSASPGDGQKGASGSDDKRKTGTELPSDPAKMTDPAKWPAWIFCTRYSDRPSSGPRLRRAKKDRKPDEKRPRTAFTSEQLARLKNEFTENRYLNEKRRQELANELQLHENQIKIWFQNKRAKIKKITGQKNPLALQLMAQGLYNHSTVPIDGEDDEDYQSQSQNEQLHSD